MLRMRLEESQVPRKEQGTGKVRRRVSSNWLQLFSKKAVVFMRCCQFFRIAVEFRLEAHLQFEHLNLRLPVRSLSSQMDLLYQPQLKLIQNKVSLWWNIISPNHCWKYRWVFWGGGSPGLLHCEGPHLLALGNFVIGRDSLSCSIVKSCHLCYCWDSQIPWLIILLWKNISLDLFIGC